MYLYQSLFIGLCCLLTLRLTYQQVDAQLLNAMRDDFAEYVRNTTIVLPKKNIKYTNKNTMGIFKLDDGLMEISDISVERVKYERIVIKINVADISYKFLFTKGSSFRLEGYYYVRLDGPAIDIKILMGPNRVKELEIGVNTRGYKSQYQLQGGGEDDGTSDIIMNTCMVEKLPDILGYGVHTTLAEIRKVLGTNRRDKK